MPVNILGGALLLILSLPALADGTLDWSALGWSPDGSLSQSYPDLAAPVVTIDATVSGNTPAMASNTPLVSGANLVIAADHMLVGQSLDIELVFSIPLVDLQLNIYDIDRGTTMTWIDELTITATDLDGNAAFPVIAPGSHYSVTGTNDNVVTGLDTTDFTAVTPVSFPQAIRSVQIRYGNNSAAMANPAYQVIAIGDLDWRNEADLSLVKDDSQVFYTPGGNATYTLTVENAGPNAANGAVVSDTLPAGTRIDGNWTCLASGGASCISGSPPGTATSGTGNINQSVDIPRNGRVVFTIPITFSSNPADY